ncbi:MAG: DUF4190 domain-containing protein [Phycisphaerales bacterium JB059]
MTQNPYAEAGAADVFPEAERTSVMAILSLVCSIICCIPGLGILGALLGVFAMIGIGGSRGRVGGKGLAIAGIIIGLLVTVLWVGVFIGGRKAFGAYMSLVGPVMQDIEASDFDAARSSFDADLSTVSDEAIAGFRGAYQAELGSFQRVPDSWMELFSMFADPEVGPNMQKFQGRNDLIPAPGVFDQGNALVLMIFDPTSQTGGPPRFSDVVVITADGTEIRLTDFQAGVAPAQPDTDLPEPENPDPGQPAPADEGP